MAHQQSQKMTISATNSITTISSLKLEFRSSPTAANALSVRKSIIVKNEASAGELYDQKLSAADASAFHQEDADARA